MCFKGLLSARFLTKHFMHIISKQAWHWGEASEALTLGIRFKRVRKYLTIKINNIFMQCLKKISKIIF